MSEIEAPIEQVSEEIHETAHHSKESWIGKVALYSALVAAIAAVSAMLAGHHSDEAMITQIRASDQWSYYQAKGIKAAIAELKEHSNSKGAVKIENAEELEKETKGKEQYKEEQKEISKEAKALEAESSHHLALHSMLAKAVTLFQVAIAVAAISVLTRRRRYWYVSMIFSAGGLIFFILGLI